MNLNPNVVFPIALNTVSRRTSIGNWVLWRTSLILLLSCFAIPPSLAQNAQFTQGSDPTGLDHSMSIPLGAYPGRGSANLSVNLFYSSQLWRIDYKTNVYADPEGWPPGTPQVKRALTEAIYAEHSKAGWTTSLDVPKVEWPKITDRYWYSGKPYHSWVSNNVWRVSRVFIHLPDGSTHELRESDQPYLDTGPIDMTGTFYAVDGSRMRYTTPDSTAPSLPDGSTAAGVLYMPDGSRYVLGSTYSLFVDRNGNTLTYNSSSRQWTDALNRQLNIPLPINPSAQDYTYPLPGIGGDMNYTFKWRQLSNVLTPVQGQTPTLLNVSSHGLPSPCSPPTSQGGGNFPAPVQGGSLFSSSYSDPEQFDPPPPLTDYTYVVSPCNQSNGPFNPVVLAEIVLPNGQSYKFSYNIYGEMDKVIYPTGAYGHYDYSKVLSTAGTGLPYSDTSRGVIKRQLSANGTGNDLVEWRNNAATSYSPLTFTAPDGTQTQIKRCGFSNTTSGYFGFLDVRNGMVFEVRTYGQGSLPIDLNNPKGPPLRRTLTNWVSTTNVVPPRINPVTGQPYMGLNPQVTAYRNPRPDKMVSIMLDTGGLALAKMVETEYQSNGYELSTGLDLTKTIEHHFASVNQTTAQSGDIANAEFNSGPIARSAETTYSTDTAYRNRNILGLSTGSIVSDANGNIVAWSETFYDETTTYPLLTYPSVPGWTNPSTNKRANVTTSRRYKDIGAYLYFETHAQYDQCGSIRNSFNERGIQSKVEYDSTYRVYAVQTTTAAPDPSGAHGSTAEFTSTTNFHVITGLVLSTIDANGQETTYRYLDDQNNPDPLNRVLKVTRPDFGWTKYVYNDTVGNLYKYIESQMDGGRTTKAYQYFDALGRAFKSALTEGTSSLVTETQYDSMGRVWKVSNPYRTPGAANGWTTTIYDDLNRVKQVTLPDNTTLLTEYQGIYTTVTDPALMKRRQKVDALGQIVRIDEPDSSGNLGSVDAPAQACIYDYDTLGNLVHITQGGNSGQPQHRYYKYDALSRLTYERQVEQAAPHTAADPLNNQWSRKVVYDETINGVSFKGLVTSMYDARNIQTQFQYDQINRVWQVTYNDGTPTLTNKYDQARTGYFNKGKLTEASTAVVGDTPQTGQVYDFDLMGRVVKQTQTVDTNSYTLRYAYNLGGQLIQETYPSGRVINLGYDEASRLANVNGGQGHNFISAISYTPQGTLSSATLGNNAIYTYGYNIRLQLATRQAIRNNTVLQKYEYKYGQANLSNDSIDETRNNGQIGRIESWIGTQKQWQQRFVYDSLGRLITSAEYRGDNSQQTYQLNFSYDVFANRYQYQAANSGNQASLNQKWVEASDISTSTNRFTSNVGYDTAGNVTSDPKFRNLEYQYDANGRMKQSSQPNGVNPVKAVFDGAGQRVATKTNGALAIMVYDVGGKLVAEYGQTAPTTASIQYIMADHQGSTRLVTDRSGAVISRHDYQPFGEEIPAGVGMRTTDQKFSSPDNVRQKYAGMETDDATKMAHTLWRKYDGHSGRWTTPDPYGGSMTISDPQSFNRYTYVNNDPINLVDPLGLMSGADASQSWGDVSGTFWPVGFNFNASHLMGQEIFSEREADTDKRAAKAFKDAADKQRANKAIRKNNMALAIAIVNANNNLVMTAKITFTKVKVLKGYRQPSSDFRKQDPNACHCDVPNGKFSIVDVGHQEVGDIIQLQVDFTVYGGESELTFKDVVPGEDNNGKWTLLDMPNARPTFESTEPNEDQSNGSVTFYLQLTNPEAATSTVNVTVKARYTVKDGWGMEKGSVPITSTLVIVIKGDFSRVVPR